MYLTEKGVQLQQPLDAAMDRVNAEFVSALGKESAADLWRDLATIAGLGQAEGASSRVVDG